MTESNHEGVRGAGAARLDRRMLILGAFGLTAASWASILESKPAFAHHGWPGFDTSRLIYLAGAVSSEGTWGNPHSLFNVTLEAPLPPSMPKLTLPQQLQGAEDTRRVTDALSYSGPHKQLQIIIAPRAWSGRWGLGRALTTGERFQAVGYINRTATGSFARWCSGMGTMLCL